VSERAAPRVDVGALVVKDLDGVETTLAAIAKNKPVLLVFVRHFG
jgi:hypothetical protein